MLVKFLAALVVAIVGSSTLTAFLASRLTEAALRRQATRVTLTSLRTLTQEYGERDARLQTALVSLREYIAKHYLDQAPERADLVAELGRQKANLGIQLLQLLHDDGTPLDPEASVGSSLLRRLPVAPDDRRSSVNRLVATEDGWMESVTVPVYTTPPLYLVGGYSFDDTLAYSLRQKLSDIGHVVLVADGKLAGSTLTHPDVKPPGQRGSGLPTRPATIKIDGSDNLVAYQVIGGVSGGATGALGVSLTDPEGPLDRSLAQTRFLAAALLAAGAVGLGWMFFRILVRPLVALTATATSIAGGDLEASFAAPGNDEVAVLAQSLERMRLELRAQLDLIATQASNLRDSSQRIVAAQDEERHRLARDLHDGIQQHLVVLRMGFGLVTEAADRAGDTVHRSLQELSAELDSVIEQLREVSHDLYPSILVDRGLAAALRTSLARLALPATLVCTPDPLPRLPAEVESGAYFLISEALTNALKHAGASELTVRLTADDAWLSVEVSDDGRGFTPDGTRNGGLLHMEDRARSFGGDLSIRAAPGVGTVVRARFPIRAAAEVAGPG
ncbi:MAG TPA: histidine kinase [Acidimicrobiales bacterium]|nr:histidine kinase [Acidimicrobiales bacterium]